MVQRNRYKGDVLSAHLIIYAVLFRKIMEVDAEKIDKIFSKKQSHNKIEVILLMLARFLEQQGITN
ncbi:hypothetical protein [Bartonella sp. CB74]|uniref:hypothetical protein n=1 Tax=Bartonella sp. CB74 TaxID=3113620 RepID=UPI002F962F48